MFSDEDANQYLDNETKLKRKPQNMVHEEQTSIGNCLSTILH